MSSAEQKNKETEIFFHTPSPVAQKLLYYPIVAGIYRRTQNYRISRERLDSFLAIYVLDGKMGFQQGETEGTAKCGDVILIDCYQPHVYFAENETKLLWLHFDGGESRKWYEEITTGKGQVFPLSLTAAETLVRIVELIRKNKNEYLISETIYTFLCEVMRPDKITPYNTEIRTAIRTAEAYIREHYAESLTVAHVAAQTHFSESYFNNLFRRVTGFSVYEYLLKTRLEAAKVLLTQTDLSVAHIAFRTGFNSASNFMCFFKKQTGLSALKFRKMNF